MNPKKETTTGIICSQDSQSRALDNVFIKSFIRQHIETLYADGYRTFISGMERGYDMLVAEEVCCLKGNIEFNDLSLEIYLAWSGQTERYGWVASGMCDFIRGKADKITSYYDRCFAGCHRIRNERIVEDCSVLISLSHGADPSVTEPLKQAAGRGVKIIDLEIYDNTMPRKTIHLP